MGSAPRRSSQTELGPDWLPQWADAQLVEKAELLEADVTRLSAECDRLKVELHFARSWAEGSLWSEESGAQSRLAALEGEQLAPIVWARVPLLIGIVVIPWSVIGFVVYLVWQLAS